MITDMDLLKVTSLIDCISNLVDYAKAYGNSADLFLNVLAELKECTAILQDEGKPFEKCAAEVIEKAERAFRNTLKLAQEHTNL